MAQLLAAQTGFSAYTFNAPGIAQTQPFLSDELSRINLQSSSTGPITNYRVYGDLISAYGIQLGSNVTVEPPLSKSIIDGFPAAMAKSMHLISTVIERLTTNAPATGDFGPTVGSSIFLTTVTGILSFPAAALYWYAIDPGGVDGYFFDVLPGSPLIQSVTFPFLLDVEALFDLHIFENDEWRSIGYLQELETYDFGLLGVNAFKFFIKDYRSLLPILGVEEFTFFVTFVSDGMVTARLESFSTVVPEPSSIAILCIAIGFVILAQFASQRRVYSGSRTGLHAGSLMARSDGEACTGYRRSG